MTLTDYWQLITGDWLLLTGSSRVLSDRQGDDKGAALARGAGSGDCAIVPFDDAAADGQANAGTFIFVTAVEPLKHRKYSV